jgi:hypothetical protein
MQRRHADADPHVFGRLPLERVERLRRVQRKRRRVQAGSLAMLRARRVDVVPRFYLRVDGRLRRDELRGKRRLRLLGE